MVRNFADIAADLLRQAEKLVFGRGDIYPNCGKKLHFCTAKGLKRNSLIECIEVHNNDKYDSYCYARADIYFTVVGILDSPVKKESLDMYERSPG